MTKKKDAPDRPQVVLGTGAAGDPRHPAARHPNPTGLPPVTEAIAPAPHRKDDDE